MNARPTARILLSIFLFITLASGCYRTRYIGLGPESPRAAQHIDESSRERRSGWQHFFVYGWAPGTRTIDAAELCDGRENIHSIETERRFVQGLIAAFAGYYINIYSPWNGAVYCHVPSPGTGRERVR